MNPPIIQLSGVSKSFTVPVRRDATILSRMIGAVRRGTGTAQVRSITALRDIDFSVERGEVIGIIGRNAAGKSTLLRVIAGIIVPEAGKVRVHARVTSLMNLSVGLHDRLTVRDNIFLGCSLLGMRHAEIKIAFDSIVEFAGIGEFVEMYPYQLSLGMNQRMAFAIAVSCHPEILLLDEVFSAGDAAFVAKSEKRMAEIIRGNVTVVMASHDLDRVSHLCDRVLWLDHGALVMQGNPVEVISAYRKQTIPQQ